jgi:hypothetical protein
LLFALRTKDASLYICGCLEKILPPKESLVPRVACRRRRRLLLVPLARLNPALPHLHLLSLYLPLSKQDDCPINVTPPKESLVPRGTWLLLLLLLAHGK